MIDRPALLEDLQALLTDLRDDIRERVDAQPDLEARLREEHRAAREAARTGEAGIARCERSSCERSSIDSAGREPVALCTWGQWVAWTTP